MSLAAAPRRLVLADVVARPAGRARAFALDAALVLAGVALVALLAKVSVPMFPVPITGQTLGVLIVGAALGARRGAASLASYAAIGLAGAPVFAGAVAGPAYVLSPSFGFILGFILAAFVAGWFAERRWDRSPWLAFVGFGAASILPFVVGVPYMALALSVFLGEQVTFGSLLQTGVVPFILGGVIKAAAAALLIPAAWLAVRAADRTKR